VSDSVIRLQRRFFALWIGFRERTPEVFYAASQARSYATTIMPLCVKVGKPNEARKFAATLIEIPPCSAKEMHAIQNARWQQNKDDAA
jgi:hypothetical protein